ncbi:S8 family peptidase [Actinopolymorpha sp. NPDC004070]|uniref:S8 family peptidase n=1 Tax=Actinopolymorpha sp. NPDC004070 TaxID=3154548 RepID=UPI0033B03E3B
MCGADDSPAGAATVSKLDPTLLGILARRRDATRRPRAARAAEEESFEPRQTPDTVHVMVKFTGDVDDLRALGFEPLSLRTHPTEGWTIAAGPMPTDRLPDLDDLDHVVKVEASRPMRPELDRSVPEIRAKQLHDGSPSFTGAGVVVGVIDSGIDWFHHSFRKPDGTSRILGIWDQTLVAQAGESAPAAFPGMGVEYTKAHIDAALAGTGTVRTKDKDDGHGTHVAGIAAGDGSQSGNCSGAFTYVGVAPGADIIIVVNTAETDALGESVNLVHALDFIWDHPGVAGRPVVINLSQGDNLGAHDGTALVEQMIDLDLLLHDGHMVVKSAGNEGEADHHAQVTIAAGASTDVPVHMPSGDRFSRFAEMWYAGAGSVRCTVLAPSVRGAPPTSPAVDPGNATPWTVDSTLPANRQTVVRIDSRTADPDNNDRSIHIEWDPAAKANIPAGEWKLRLANTGAVPVTVHMWLERGSGPVFGSGEASRAGTISIPGTARSVITVGAYSQSGFLFFNWSGKVAGFSSRGATRDGRTKPDVSAPGVAIKSAKSNVRPNCCCDCCRDFYVDMDGTSMAAPHVTGVVALMYQKNPRLKASDVRRHIMETARVPDGLTPADLPNNDYGAGKVDAAAAVAAVPPPGAPVHAPEDRERESPGPDPHELHAPVARAGRGAQEGEDGRGGEPKARWAHTSRTPRTPRALRTADIAAPLLAALHTRLLAVPSGEGWAADVSRHFSEVRGLINHNRRVAVTWHRMQGPALVASLAHQVAGSPGGVALPAVSAADLARRVGAFLDALERHGSTDLADSIRRRRPEILAVGAVDLLHLLAGAARPAA